MSTYLDIEHKPVVALLLCVLLIVSVNLAANDELADQSISDLRRKAFRISTQNGKQSMTLITGYSGEPWAQKWWAEGYAKPCTNNVAKLNRPETAAVIKGTSNILAFLDCPAANDGGAASIISLFEMAKTDTPICFGYLRLMDKSEYHYWGIVKSIEVRKLPDNNFIVVPTLSGRDAGDSWVSYAFLHMDTKCNLTLLSKFYASMYYGTDDSGDCEGESLMYEFDGDSTVRLRKNQIRCTKTEKTTSPLTIIKLDLKALLRDPTLRVSEP